MLRIECPWCGVRDETEFTFGGEAHLSTPANSGDSGGDGDRAWADYLFMRGNPMGVHHERWRHSFGCRQWFHVARHTVSHDILAVYGIAEPAPGSEGSGGA